MRLHGPYLAVCVVGVVHFVIAGAELFYWDEPCVMTKVLSEGHHAAARAEFNQAPAAKRLAAMIVHNAGVYNGIVGAALIAAALAGARAHSVQAVLLVGVIVAGAFGAITLEKKEVWVQAALGAAALIYLSLKRDTSNA